MEDDLPVLTCALIVYQNGELVWEVLRDYLRNPAPGSYIKGSIKMDGAFWIPVP